MAANSGSTWSLKSSDDILSEMLNDPVISSLIDQTMSMDNLGYGAPGVTQGGNRPHSTPSWP